MVNVCCIGKILVLVVIVLIGMYDCNCGGCMVVISDYGYLLFISIGRYWIYLVVWILKIMLKEFLEMQKTNFF